MILIVKSLNEIPYTPEKGYEEVKTKLNKIYKGKSYSKIIFEKKHGIFWRFAKGSLALLATITIVPLLINSKAIKALWREANTGTEKKTVLISQAHLPPAPDLDEEVNKLKTTEEVSTPKPGYKVQFGLEKGKEIDEEEAPNKVAEQNSILLADLAKPEKNKVHLGLAKGKESSIPNQQNQDLQHPTPIALAATPPKVLSQVEYIENLVQDLWNHGGNYWKEFPRVQVDTPKSSVNETIMTERQQWIDTGKSNQLSACICHNHEFDDRKRIEQNILTRLIAEFPPKNNPEVSILSLASGDLLQDWLLINELAALNYNKINIQLVDPLTSNDLVNQLIKLSNALAAKKGIEINIKLAKTIQEIQTIKNYQCIHGFDFTYLLAKDTNTSWQTIIKSMESLDPRGFLQCTAGPSNIIFDAKSKNWHFLNIINKLHTQQDFSSLCIVHPSTTIKYAITDIECFFMHDLPIIAALAAQNYKIQIDLLKGHDPHNLEKLLNGLFNAEIHVNCVSKLNPDTYHIITGSSYRFGRKMMGDTLVSLNKGGYFILNSGAYYQSTK